MAPTEPMFQDKIVWIAGASSGVGEAAALAFARQGATLVLSGRRHERLEFVAKAAEALGGKAHALPGDLGDRDIARNTVEFIQTSFGRLDVLVNCVGVNIRNRSWEELDAQGIDEVIEGNLSVPFYCTIAALPLMRAQRSGTMIHISSIAGTQINLVGGPAYSAAKHGVVALSHTLNKAESRNGVRSSVICPGGINTTFLDKRPAPVPAEERARLLRPGDIADLILYIAGLPPSVCIDEVTITPVAR
jgi:NADP-dependent 3-hydroxy acid dehydrogenase YdfG